MVVDRRVDDSNSRDVEVTFHEIVTGVTEVGEQSGKNTQWDPQTRIATLEGMNAGEGRLLSLEGRLGKWSESSPCVPGASLCEGMEQRLDPANLPWDKDGPVMHVTFDELLDEHSGKWAADYASGANDVWFEESAMPTDGPIGFGNAVDLPKGTADGQVFGKVFDAYLPETLDMTIALWVKPLLPEPLDSFVYNLISVGSTWDMTNTIRAYIGVDAEKGGTIR